MDHFSVRLPREVSQSLKVLAERMQREPSELIRMAVCKFLQTQADFREQLSVQDLLGSVKSNIPDLATRHREYIRKSLRQGQ